MRAVPDPANSLHPSSREGHLKKAIVALARRSAVIMPASSTMPDARVLDQNVQSGKMLHAALLLLMLEVVHTDLVSPSA